MKKTNEPNRTRGMETRSGLTATRGREERGKRGRKGKGLVKEHV